MELVLATRLFAGLCLAFCVAALAWRWRVIQARPNPRDLARPRGATGPAVLYAFTLSLAPWEKESTRKHWVAYLRGILFHLGILSGLVFFLFSLVGEAAWPSLTLAVMGLAGLGGLAGLLGVAERWMDENAHALSVPDDYAAVVAVTLFLFLTLAAASSPAARPAFWVWSGLMLLYLPFGKVRHCFYFFYSKFFLGSYFGRRGVLPPRHTEDRIRFPSHPVGPTGGRPGGEGKP